MNSFRKYTLISIPILSLISYKIYQYYFMPEQVKLLNRYKSADPIGGNYSKPFIDCFDNSNRVGFSYQWDIDRERYMYGYLL